MKLGTDADLIEAARAGDGPALTALIERLRDEIYRLSLRMLCIPKMPPMRRRRSCSRS